VAGARPNFMKVAAVRAALARDSDAWRTSIVHTGQHYDFAMSKIFWRELGIPEPDAHLEAGSGTHGAQTGRVMEAFEKFCAERKPEAVVVVGDVNSTLGAAVVACKLAYPTRFSSVLKRLSGRSAGPLVAHVEAGLRSRDRRMPEEINRILTDRISDLLFTTCAEADANLREEGIPGKRIHFVGNVMVDSLLSHLDRARELDAPGKLALAPGDYGLVTLHRPVNVDDPAKLSDLLRALGTISARIPLVMPVHPRTREAVDRSGLSPDSERFRLIAPQGYFEFLSLMMNSRFVLTDSGGVQEETSVLGIPCLTLRPTTERPITIALGTNRLTRLERLKADVDHVLASPVRERTRRRIPLWDGKASLRIAGVLRDVLREDA
jgi:UDP-N-acetylglucosamine 2-epimerase (non-hydrolysing)